MAIKEYRRGFPTYKGKNGQTIGMLCETKEQCITDDDGVSLPDKLAELKEYTDDAYANSNLYTDMKIGELINGAPTTLDTLKEIADAMEENADVVEALDVAVGSKVDQAEYDGHADNDTIHITAEERTKWNNNSGGNGGDAETLNGLTSKEVGASGARNLIPYPYYSGVSKTQNGITFTENGDGGITTNNGTATGDAYYYLTYGETMLDLPNGECTISGGISEFGVYVVKYLKTDNTRTYVGASRGTPFTFETSTEYKYEISARVTSGITVDNATIYPMLELGSVAHDYVPYHFGGAEHALEADNANTVDGLHAYEFMPYHAGNNRPYATAIGRLEWNSAKGAFEWIVRQNDVLQKVDADTVDGWHIYSSLSELGLDEATATAESIVNAMGNGSVLFHKLSGTATSATLQFPYAHSTLIVKKLSVSYAPFECIGTGNSLIYYAYYNGGATTKWSGWSTKFLPLTGGEMSGNIIIRNTGPIFRLINTVASNRENRLGVTSGGISAYFNLQDANNYSALFINKETADLATLLEAVTNINGVSTRYPVHHDGNSAKCVVVDTDPGVGVSVNYADGTLIFVKEG